MHELSIAMNIADLAVDRARQAGASRIMAIELDIGTLAGVELSALDHAMKIAFRDSLLENAEIKLNRIEARCECRDCGHDFALEEFSLQCPACGKNRSCISRGMEMQLSSILIE